MAEKLIIIGTFGFVVFFILAIFAGKNDKNPRERIMRSLGREELNEKLPTFKEHFSAFLKGKGQINKDSWSRKLSKNGADGELKVLQLGFGVLIGLFLFIFSLFLNATINIKLGSLILGFLIGYLLPNSSRKAQIKKKKQEIEKSLPDVLDLLTVSVEAGLGFDAALLKVTEKQKGALAEEFFKVLQEIKMGRPRRDALRDLSKRNTIGDLSNFVAALVQADQLGIPIGGVLRNQSKQIRQKHRQRAEEKAQKAPVKMMIPLVLFVFPSVFIVILGPAAIQIIDMFNKMN